MSPEGRILITPFAASPAVLFTPDLSVTRELPGVFLASPSGNTGAEITKNGWKLYQIGSQSELVREGKGSFRSVSDEVIAFQDGNVMRIETLQGTRLGSFSVKPEVKCYNVVYPIGTDRLYFDDCKKIRVVAGDSETGQQSILLRFWNGMGAGRPPRYVRRYRNR